MWAFLGLIVSMGLIVIDYLEDYWSTDCMYKLPFYSAVMKKERFCLILSFLHLFNNEDQVPRGQPGHDPIFKIRSFVNRLRKNFKNVFAPGDKVAVDKAMVAWRGPLAFLVFSPDKLESLASRFSSCATAAQPTAATWNSTPESKRPRTAVPPLTCVNRLISPYLGCGRTLYVDNFYASPDLFTFLR